jgi:hypothetical protein
MYVSNLNNTLCGRLDPMNKELGHGENFLVKHYAGNVVYTVTGEDRVNSMRAMWSTQSQVRIGLTLCGQYGLHSHR